MIRKSAKISICISAALIIGALLPETEANENLKLVAWVATVVIGGAVGIGAVFALNTLTEGKKSFEGTEDPQFQQLVKAESGFLGFVSSVLNYMTIIACAYAGWGVPAVLWLIAAFMMTAVRVVRSEYVRSRPPFPYG